MKPPKVVIVGHVCIDENRTEHALYTKWGSSVLYIDDVLQREYGVQPTILTEYGPDLLQYYNTERFIPHIPSQPRSLQYKNDTSVVPRIWRCFNMEYAGEPELTKETIAALRAADIVILATLLPNYTIEYVTKLMKYVPESALKVLCPQGYLREITPDGLVVPRIFQEASALLPLFDITIYSEEDTPHALDLATTWSEHMQTAIIVTQGDKGASIITNGTTTHVPTVPIPIEEIIDSVGCGDVFDAAVTYEYYESRNLEQAVRMAHQATAKKLRLDANGL